MSKTTLLGLSLLAATTASAKDLVEVAGWVVAVEQDRVLVDTGRGRVEVPKLSGFRKRYRKDDVFSEAMERADFAAKVNLVRRKY